MEARTSERWLLYVLLASQFAPAYMFSGVAVALADLSADLQPSAIELGLIETLFLAGSTALLLPMGRIADATDRRSIYKWGLWFFALTSALIPLLSWVPALLCVRFLQGVVSAALTASGPAIMVELVPAERRGRVFGAAIGVTYTGLSLGPLCAGYLVEWGGWQAVFWGGAAMLVLFASITEWKMKSRFVRAPNPVHIPSALLLAAAVIALVLGTSFWSAGLPGWTGIGLAVLLGAVFLAWQRRLTRPLLDLRALVGHPTLKAALGVQFLLYLNAYANVVLMSLYLQVALAKSAVVAGQVLAVASALMAVLAPFSGVLADRWRPVRVAGAGVAVILLMSALACSLDDADSVGFILLLLVLHGVGFALFSTPNMTLIMSSVSREETATASALSAKSRSMGMIGGMLVIAVLFAGAFGSDPVQKHPHELGAVARQVYSVLTVTSALALALTVWNGRIKPRSASGSGSPSTP